MVENKKDITNQGFTPPENPYDLFDAWFLEASNKELNDPGAMCLATATPDGVPSARMVLLKEFDEDGFKFHTNIESRKGNEITQNSKASICFHWKSLRKQVRLEGTLHEVLQKESQQYFETRNRKSQIGAWASNQSRELENYQTLQERYKYYEEKFKDEKNIPKPDYWVGFRLKPNQFEFWNDGENRLHKRYIYTQDKQGNWTTGMLYP